MLATAAHPGYASTNLQFQSGRRLLEVVVADQGCGMSPHFDGTGAGLGLPLIAELTESMSVRPAADGPGTVVSMTFALPVEVVA